MSSSSLFKALASSDRRARVNAAVAIGHECPEGAAKALVAQLSREKDVTVAAACCAALELLGDKGAIESLKVRLKKCPDDQVWDIAHAVGRLTGIEPLVPQGAKAGVLRKTWLKAIKGGGKPDISAVTVDSEFARFSLDRGLGRIRFDYDPPPTGEVNWPRWNRSLFVGDKPLYGVGSACGTCETVLNLVGWPEERAFELARQMSSGMQDNAQPSSLWIKEWSPILKELQTGHYLVAPIDLPVERVAQADSSWMTLRQHLRDWNEEEDGPQEIDEAWPGTDHYQGPTFAGEMRAFWTILPSQDLAVLNEVQVGRYVGQIREGKKPTVLTLGWMEDRYVQAEWNERFVVLCVLDGHHKLEAYSRCKEPAHVIALFHLENTWGPREDPSGPLVDAIRQLQHEYGQMSADIGSSGKET